MIQRAVERMYSEDDDNRFLEVTYANGDKEVLYFRDFNSGAMLENIVARAKKSAIGTSWPPAERHPGAAPVGGLRRRVPRERGPAQHHQPGRLGADLGQEGERIVFIRTLIKGKTGGEPGRSIDTTANTGQYL